MAGGTLWAKEGSNATPPAGEGWQLKDRVVTALLERHGRTYAKELGLDLAPNTPSVLFRWMCASLLLSARISSDIAMGAARALAQQGWTTAERMAGSTWEERTRTLNESGYARYDERTSRMLGDTASLLLEEYHGDLRKLREAAGRDSRQERRLLKRFKGLGEVGVDIFFREAQIAWDELYPFADERALKAAGELGLGRSVRELAGRVPQAEFPRLVAALIRGGLAKDLDAIAEQARAG